jgi:hypothetical protein
MAKADPSAPPRTCPACGGRLLVLVRLKTSEARTPLAYFKCERCAHILIAEE